jgi:GNAT acetyltransferase-like protein
VDQDRLVSKRRLEVRGTTYCLERVLGPEMAPLVPLLDRTFQHRDFTLDWLRKKYACEYEGVRGFSCVAFTKEGQAVASLGVLPWPMCFGNHRELAAQVVDGATHHEHRRRGLFALLGQMAVELCDAAGISFLFGFAETQRYSYPGLIRHVSFTHIDDLLEYRLPIRTLYLERVAGRIRPLRRLYERKVERMLSKYFPGDAVLQNSLLAAGFAATARDRAFHEYKSFDGSRVLAVDGGRVWLKIRHGLMVGDIEALLEAEMDKTVQALERLAAGLGIHQVVFQSSKDTRFSRFFTARFRSTPCLSVLYRNLRSQIPPGKLRFTSGDLDNF